MTKPRLNLSDRLVFVAFCRIAFAAYRYFFQPVPFSNARLYLSAFLACLAIATLGSFCGRPTWRRSFQAFAAFGWLELIFGMRGGLQARTPFDGRRITEGSQMGIVFGILCAILAGWLFEPPSEQRGQRSGTETRG
jgi:hypothetical protein